jgi:nitrogen fixation protein NifU and related proteins
MTNHEAMEDLLRDAENVGEMPDADSVGTAGSEDCGDMLRMWVKFREKDGRRVIDKASFQTFGCQTALAVATAAARMIRGKTAEEALQMNGTDLSAPLGPLPPMKIHCAQLVESALRDALAGGASPVESAVTSPPPKVPQPSQGNLAEALQSQPTKKIVFLPKSASS